MKAAVVGAGVHSPSNAVMRASTSTPAPTTRASNSEMRPGTDASSATYPARPAPASSAARVIT
jgi:hypothetical protein